jgi:DNA ligase 1
MADVLLVDLVRASAEVAATRSRNAKITRIAALLRAVGPHEAPIAVAWLSGELQQGRIGVGPSTLRAALDSPAARMPTLPIARVNRVFTDLAAIAGAGANTARVDTLGRLFAEATPEERQFLAALLAGDLRQGALEGVMIDAVATAADVPAAELRRAAMLAGDLVAVAAAAFLNGRAGLAGFRVQLFRPLQPMLADSAADVDAAMTALGEASLEYKLDGARIQVHVAGADVRVYSRLLNDVTESVPEIVAAALALPVREAILDGEVLALREGGGPHDFQTTMRRFGRRLDVPALQRELPLTPFFFDLLHVDGETLLDRTAADRFDALLGAAPGLAVPRMITADAGLAADFLTRARAAGHEGIMAKALTAPYEAGRRGSAWLKIKPVHTLDLVILAAEWGHGRRQGWLSNLHLGARDAASGGFVMLGKTFKGLTDAMLEWQTRELLAREISRDAYTVHVRPELVAEIAFNEIQDSTRYAGGLALRFARVTRYRPDKTAGQADTIETVRSIRAGVRPG